MKLTMVLLGDKMDLRVILAKAAEWANENRNNIARVAIVVIFLGLAIWGLLLEHLGYVIGNVEPWLFLTTTLKNVGPELAGIVIGIVTIDYLNERRQEQQFKAQLIRQMSSRHNEVAGPAVRELAHHGWLYDASLQQANLTMANLKGANLIGADLARTLLMLANLEGALLQNANLEEAGLVTANLTRANLTSSSLVGATLLDAELKEACLLEANLAGANMEGANLEDAQLINADLTRACLGGVKGWKIEQLLLAKSLRGAIMPEGIKYEEWIQKPAVKAKMLELGMVNDGIEPNLATETKDPGRDKID